MIELKWEEPSADGRRRSKQKWLEVVEALRSNPGAWAVIAEDISTATAVYLKRKYPGIEATVRGTKNGRAAKVYARWVGDT